MPVYIQNIDTGLVLDVKGAAQESGTEVIMWRYKGSANQHWEYQDNMFISSLNGLALDVNVSTGAVTTYNTHGGENQKWYFEGEGVIKSGDGRVLDVADNNTSKGGAVIVYAMHGGDNQKFRLVDV